MLPGPADAIALFARSRPDKVAASELVSGEAWSYAELDTAVARLAGHLLGRGCRKGQRIAVVARNSVEQVILHFACSRAGLIYVPLNWRLSPAELSVLVDRCRPDILAADERSAALLAGRSDVEDLGALIESSRAAKPLAGGARGPDRPSLILFTSGTSGKPKGAVLSERNLQQTAINFSILTSIDGGSSFLCEAPMFHVIGLVANIRPVFQQGGSILVSEGFDVERTLDWLSDGSLAVSHYVGVPQMIEGFRRQPGFDAAPLRRMTAIVTGGAPHAEKDIEAWLDDGISLVAGFGMSEAGTVFGMPTDPDVIRSKLGSVGMPAPTTEVRLVDNDGNDCRPGEAGELWLRGDNIMLGYWEDPELTADAFAEGGWFKSGDIARCDDDGFFWIVDRKKDMFISGGENIYPAEIEAVLADYPGISEAAVVGVPDERWGEVGCLVLVPDPARPFEKEAVIGYMKQRLASYKIPKKIVTVDVLSKTPTGKIRKTRLRAELSASPRPVQADDS